MKELLLNTGLFWLRVMTGLGMTYHGFGKVFGGTMSGLIEGVTGMGFPAPILFAWAAALSEFAGGLLLIIGLLTRPAAFFVACTMFVAAFVAHGADPFKVKELALAYLVMSIALVLTGGGKFSADTLWCKRKKEQDGNHEA